MKFKLPWFTKRQIKKGPTLEEIQLVYNKRENEIIRKAFEDGLYFVREDKEVEDE